MKKLFNYALIGAIALTGSTMLTSCSSSDDAAAENNNPNFNEKTNEVTTQFVFNIAAGSNNNPVTRMSASNTQADINQLFRGITNTQLFAYKLAEDGKHVATATTANKTYALGTILAQGQLDPDATPMSRRVIELSLPVDVNALMFWGKAPKSGLDANNAQGNIVFNASNEDISQHAFSLIPRVATGSTEATTLAHYQEIILKLLNDVVNSSYTADANACVWSTDVGGDGSKNSSAINLYWSDFVSVDGSTGHLSAKLKDPVVAENNLSPLGEILADAFVILNTVATGEIRAGSGKSFHHLMGDLNIVIDKVAGANATSYEEWVAKQLGLVIQSNIRKVVDANGDLKDISAIKSSVNISHTDVTASLDNFPGNLNLPDGALQFSVVIDKTANAHPVATWSYMTNSGPTNFNYNVNKFTYPAELCYFGNSPVRVTNDTHVTADYPDGASDWNDDNSWTTNTTAGWTKNGHVLSSTRSVAMQENINYGTALLKSYVTFKSGIDKLYDNNAAIQAAKSVTESNKSFDISNSLFTLTGILIGGQAQTVGWNYIPTASSFDYVIYDKDIVSAAVPTPVVSPTDSKLQYNYTLVWDNYNSTLDKNAQGDVYVALEFVNNTGSDFYGEKNLIRAGATFYIIGKLSPSGTGKNTSSTITWPSTTNPYALPPYNSDGTTIQAPRVFIQDYVTTANFIIDQNSLQHAYNTVPDLRSAQISLGLSVDLEWRQGLEFESILGQ